MQAIGESFEGETGRVSMNSTIAPVAMFTIN